MHFLSFDIHAIDSCTSTNDEVREAAAKGADEGYAVITTRQTAGRGRAGRNWESLSGNLHASFLLKPDVPINRLSSLPLVIGLCWQELLSDKYSIDSVIAKWPNDIWINQRKCGGILMEQLDGSIIVGMGMNCAAAPAITDTPAISLSEVNLMITPQALLEEWLEYFSAAYTLWKEKGFSALIDRWNKASFDVGIPMSAHDGSTTCDGRYEGVGAYGELLLRDEDGTLHTIHAGDISLRLQERAA